MSVTLSPGASETQRPIVPGPVSPHSQRDTATRRLPWEKIGFVSLLLVTAVLYFWNLSTPLRPKQVPITGRLSSSAPPTWLIRSRLIRHRCRYGQ